MPRVIGAILPWFAMLSFCAAPSASAQEADGSSQPLWEVGVAGFGVYAQDYPAAESYGLNGLALPYVIYRGELVRLDDEDGARIVPVETARFDFSLSADAAFGASSGDIDAREGMDDLDPLIQLGPAFVLRVAELPFDAPLEVAIQGRAVFSLDTEAFGAAYRGLVLQPLLRARQRDRPGRRFRLSTSVGPVFATQELQDYFYEVDADEARPDRRAFDASGGYLGTEITVAVTAEITDRLTGFAGSEIGLYSGAANEDSPLFRETTAASLFFGLAYTLAESRRRVRR